MQHNIDTDGAEPLCCRGKYRRCDDATTVAVSALIWKIKLCDCILPYFYFYDSDWLRQARDRTPAATARKIFRRSVETAPCSLRPGTPFIVQVAVWLGHSMSSSMRHTI
jgi:hypothetical protein